MSHIQGEHGLSMFENVLLKKMSRTKGNDLTGAWRRLLNEELDDVYCSLHIFHVIKCSRVKRAGNEACIGQSGGVYWYLVWKTEGKRALGRPGHRWDGNIKMDPKSG